jgi:hypothetical protein
VVVRFAAPGDARHAVAHLDADVAVLREYLVTDRR